MNINMTNSILLVGVGGQGIILISKVLAAGLIEMGYDVKMSEIHGMSQRGGSVTTQIKYGKSVSSPNIAQGEADIIISFEKSETARALPFLKKGGKIISDSREILPMSVLCGFCEYPVEVLDEVETLVDSLIVIEAAKKAQELGNIKAQNIVLLGALIMVLDLNGPDWEGIISGLVPARFVQMNLEAFKAGKEMAI